MKRNAFSVALLVVLVVAMLGGCIRKEDLSGKTVLMVLSEKDFRDNEIKVPKEYLEKAGAKIEVATTSGGEAVGVGGLHVDADISLEDVDVSKYDAIVFIGGPGTKKYLWPSKQAQRIARDAVDSNRVVGAICLAPVVLARADVINGLRVTGFPDQQLKDEIQAAGATYTGKSVEKDGLVITASGPSAAGAFARALAEALAGSG